MMCYLKVDFWDNVIDGVYSENHKFLTIVYLNYCNILSSSQMYYPQNHMVHTSYFQIDFNIIIIITITILHWFVELTNYHKVTYIIWTYYECLSNHTHARYTRGGHSTVKLKTMCNGKKSTFYIKDHQNKSI